MRVRRISTHIHQMIWAHVVKRWETGKVRCPTYELIIFSIPTLVQIFPPGLNISTEVEIFALQYKYSHRGLNIPIPV